MENVRSVLKQLSRWIALITGVTLVAWGILFFAFDPDRYRDEFQTFASELLGYPVTVDDLDWAPSYYPTIVASKIHIANPDWASNPYLLQAQSIHIRLAIVPLLRGQFEISLLTIKQAEVHLEQDERGNVNWVVLTESSEEPLPLHAVQLRDTTIWFKKGDGEPRLFNVRKLRAKTGVQSPLSVNGTVTFMDTPFTFSMNTGVTDAGEEGLVTPIKMEVRTPQGILAGNGVIMSPGRLDMDVSLTLPSGMISGNFNVDTRSGRPVIKSRLSSKQLAYGQLLRDSGVTDKVDGRADISIRLNGTGSNLNEILGSASGSASFTGGEGTLAIANLNWWGADLVTAILPINWSHSDTTQLNCVVGRFDIEHGIASSKTIIIDTDRITIAGEISLNLVTEALEGMFTPTPKDPSLFRLAETMELYGTLRNPERKVARDSRLKTAGGLLLSIANPAAMMLAFSSIGSGVENPCAATVAQHEKKSTPPESVKAIEDMGNEDE